MKLSYNWLKDYVDLSDLSLEEIEKKVNLHISETEKCYKLIEKTDLEIGYVEKCEKLADSDHLNVCQIKLKDGLKQIVCGAPNIKSGMYVIVARVGSEFNGFKIKKTKIRGVESEGMVCSLEELGIPGSLIPDIYKNGIYYFEETPKTSDPYQELQLDDKIIELDLTPNRSDLLSVRGAAFDFAAIFQKELKLKEPKLKLEGSNNYKIELKTSKCKTFTLTRLNVKIKPSPLFIQSRLIASGIKPQNNVIDITNYVMIEYGLPSHAYDLAKLGSKIEVRDDYEGNYKALDEKEYKIEKGDLIIFSDKIVGLAGVIGGKESEITEDTSKILLEFAEFDPLSVRKTAKRLGISTEASKRFERKIPTNLIPEAHKNALELLIKYADAEIIDHNHIIDFKKENAVNFSLTRLNNFAGLNLKTEQVAKILTAYNFKYEKKDENFKVTIPARRVDLEPHFQDIAEEILRYIGFYTLPETLPNLNMITKPSKKEELITKLRNYFTNGGYNEVVNYSLVSEKKAARFQKELIKVLMPLTEDRAVMRPSISMSLVENIRYNKSYNNDDLFLFEISNLYTKDEETTKIAVAATGIWQANNVSSKDSKKVEYYYLKGIIENLFSSLNINATFKQKDTPHPLLNNYNSADIYIEEECVGYIGEICPVVAKVYNLDLTILAELDIDMLLKHEQGITYEQVSKFPAVKRDLTFVLPKDMDSILITNYLQENKTNFQNLNTLKVVDVFQLNEQEKAVTYRLKFQSNETLASKEVDDAINLIIENIDKTFKAKLRS